MPSNLLLEPSDVWPKVTDTPRRQVAKLARYAHAAYPEQAVERQAIERFVEAAGLRFATLFTPTHTNAIATWGRDTLVVAIAGTRSVADAVADSSIGPIAVGDFARIYGAPLGADDALRLHGGFLDYAGHLYNELTGTLKAAGRSLHDFGAIYLTGHSLGGAVASCAAAIIGSQLPIQRVATFGAPRIWFDPADEASAAPTCRLPTLYAVERSNDLVPELPRGPYRHPELGDRVVIGRNGAPRAQRSPWMRAERRLYYAWNCLRSLSPTAWVAAASGMGPLGRAHSMQAYREQTERWR